MLLSFSVVNELNAYFARNISDDSLDTLTEDTLVRLLDEFAALKRIDPVALYESYMVYAMMMKLSRSGILEEVLDEIEAETALAEAQSDPSLVN